MADSMTFDRSVGAQTTPGELRGLIARYKLSVARVAARLGIPATKLSKWLNENPRYKPMTSEAREQVYGAIMKELQDGGPARRAPRNSVVAREGSTKPEVAS